ncbi:hypothetical protein AVDCRST_MAG94-1594 [uncultured Leptolyngbya sp.]|uniref:Uncharacterized protein n=1 Tax=uncultured Leptolyngbya sp. TaxID=332963 RepID=A0A6J4L787_9CYAN|nr:hypothetical protein AVDCRST_MAG94-1594 [uncultured Leptolyngbya sp.]
MGLSDVSTILALPLLEQLFAKMRIAGVCPQKTFATEPTL